MEISLKVRKRDGALEDWSFDKALTSISKTGLPIDQAENITVLLEAWLRNHAHNGIVNSVDIRDKIIELLTSQDPVARESYRDYKKGV